LCDRVAVLEKGRLAFYGDSEEGIRLYMKQCNGPDGSDADLALHPNRRPGSRSILQAVRLLDVAGNPASQYRCGDSATIEITVDPGEKTANLHLGAVVEDAFGTKLFSVGTFLSDSILSPTEGRRRIYCHLDSLDLAPGRYALSLMAGPAMQLYCDAVDEAVWFDVMETDYYGNGRLPEAHLGRFLVRSRWEGE
jgi:hypothetical protein